MARRFKLKALARHSKAGQKVTYGVLKGTKFKQLALVMPPSACCCTLDSSSYACILRSIFVRWRHLTTSASPNASMPVLGLPPTIVAVALAQTV